MYIRMTRNEKRVEISALPREKLFPCEVARTVRPQTSRRVDPDKNSGHAFTRGRSVNVAYREKRPFFLSSLSKRNLCNVERGKRNESRV